MDKKLASRIIVAGMLAGLLAPYHPLQAQQPNTLTAEEVAEGWQLLFDGSSTDGWRGYGRDDLPSGNWKAVDGTLVGGGTSGDMLGTDIVTKETFRDFELSLEFKLSPGGNSGIFYRVVEGEGLEIWQNAAEYQILDDDDYVARGTRAEDAHLTGDNYDMHPATGRSLKPVGDWNLARILVRGNHVEHWLNGVKIVEYELDSEDWAHRYARSKFSEFPDFSQAENAPIGLQDHGHPTWFRNIKIRRLPAPESLSLFNGSDLTGWTIHGTERWYVEDGELVCESGPDSAYGYLATDRSFGDFDLTLEFRQESDGNSGVFFRSSIEGTVITGWQSEVAPPSLFTGGIYESYGRGWLVKPDSTLDDVLSMGEWNTMRIRAVGDNVKTWLNGVEMIELTDEKIGRATGQIALQIHDGGGIKVRWRNIQIKEL